jgi:hypothetical protein
VPDIIAGATSTWVEPIGSIIKRKSVSSRQGFSE